MTEKRNLADIEIWVEARIDLSGGDFTKADLSSKCLENGLFSNSDFSGADLSDASIGGADFTGCKFIGANLSATSTDEAIFADADMTGVDLRDADIENAIFKNCTGLYDAGKDPRGYRFVGVQHKHGWRIKAGCRWFSEEFAIDHWTMRGNDDALERVRRIIDSNTP